MSSPWDDFEQRLACEGEWHVDCAPLTWPMDARVAAGYVERNLSVLSTIAVLEDRRSDSADDDNPLMQEMLRLDAKLNALLDIVNRLLVPTALPTRQTLRFNAVGALLPATLPSESEALLLRIRFDASPGLLLELPARCLRQFDDGRRFVQFEQCSDALREGLERLVFRHHRRKVAVIRHAGF
ncbi:PilZ domain-containing protein [Dyella tabacisoli]|uniref:PilZ domain-containing protein n=1 Tax=Dyella tabacisoli TaxID=2282381 RepID=A0A369UI19_9GAMM|nr:PilZ domain-containing protein [Dyella tabacisoli]RDD79755.1 PilZ domain-containing protein [Dyella tabacisoli]